MMVFYIRSHRGWDELLSFAAVSVSPVWIDEGIHSPEEIAESRAKGMDLTNFTIETEGEPHLSTIKMHQPNDVIWVESK